MVAIIPKNTSQKSQLSHRKPAKASVASRQLRTRLARLALSGGLLGVAVCMLGGYWYWSSGGLHERLSKHQLDFFSLSQRTGLILENVYLEGQMYTKRQAILDAMGVRLGDPLLGVSIRQIRSNLEALDWVEYAVVERQYPNTLHLRIKEYQPIAIWLLGSKQFVVEAKGRLIPEKNIASFDHLISVTGKHAPAMCASLIHTLKTQPELWKKVKKATMVSDRRWNVYLANQIEIKLPEVELEEAWEYLAKLDKEKKLLSQNISSVDLRVKDRLFVAP